MAYEAGDVVFLPFPFRDQLAQSVRPAVILSKSEFNSRGDLVVAAVTSHSPRVPTDVELRDWQTANLVKPSTVRMLIATVAQERVVHHVGRLTAVDWESVQGQLRNALAVI